jgi:hypothetical protein
MYIRDFFLNTCCNFLNDNQFKVYYSSSCHCFNLNNINHNKSNKFCKAVIKKYVICIKRVVTQLIRRKVVKYTLVNFRTYML